MIREEDPMIEKICAVDGGNRVCWWQKARPTAWWQWAVIVVFIILAFVPWAMMAWKFAP